MMKDVVARIRKNYTYFAALIGLGFLWTGTAYIIQAYRLLELLDGATVNLLTCGAYYACQAAGIGAVALFFAKRPAAAGGRLLPLIATIAALVFTAASLLASAPAVIIAVGVLLNIAIGVLSGCYLTRLATDIPQQRRGIVFGGAYAFGSIGTWLISLPMGGRFLWNDGSFFAVAILAALSLLLLRRLPSLPKMEPAGGHSQGRFTGKLIFLAAAVLFLLSMENTLGFAFPLGGAKDSVYIEFTRAFYGVGLIIAALSAIKIAVGRCLLSGRRWRSPLRRWRWEAASAARPPCGCWPIWFWAFGQCIESLFSRTSPANQGCPCGRCSVCWRDGWVRRRVRWARTCFQIRRWSYCPARFSSL